MMSIIDGSRKFLNVTNTEKASEDDQKNFLAWKRDSARKAALIACALSQPVAHLILTYSDAKDIGQPGSRFTETGLIRNPAEGYYVLFAADTSLSVCMNRAFNDSVDDGVLEARARTINGHCCVCR